MLGHDLNGPANQIGINGNQVVGAACGNQPTQVGGVIAALLPRPDNLGNLIEGQIQRRDRLAGVNGEQSCRVEVTIFTGGEKSGARN